jgi:hypothetical protein
MPAKNVMLLLLKPCQKITLGLRSSVDYLHAIALRAARRCGRLVLFNHKPDGVVDDCSTAGVAP